MKNPGRPLPDVVKLLAEIEAALPLTTWKQAENDRTSFEGDSSDGWHFVIIDGDGAARKAFLVVHLTPELARRAFELALTATQKRDTNDAAKEDK